MLGIVQEVSEHSLCNENGIGVHSHCEKAEEGQGWVCQNIFINEKPLVVCSHLCP